MQTTKVTIPVHLEVSIDRIQCLLVSAFEGGSNYWIAEFNIRFPRGTTRADFSPTGRFSNTEDNCLTPLYIVPTLDMPDAYVEVREETEEAPLHRLDLEACKRGLQLMSEKYPRHFADFLAENDDAETADVFLQCALLGEIVYG